MALPVHATTTAVAQATTTPISLSNITATAQSLWSHPSWDVVLVFALLAIGFFYGISTGKKKAATAIIYTYVTFAIFSAIPVDRLGALIQLRDILFLQIGLFAILFILLIFMFGRTRTRGFARPSAWWQIFLLSFTQIGLMIHILLGFLPKEKIATLAPLTKNVFANSDFHVWWFVGPIALLIFLKRFSSLEE
ncbi:MAG: hypothetical protein HY007_04095 [Candidatus Sungbacteria bacterium]|nr:hypothetical protein [Candidatus Sungbacteria bacterium]